MSNPVGRPTKYYPEICEEMIEFFSVDCVEYVRGEKRVVKFPTFERFAINKRLHHSTLLDWCTKYPDFSEAYALCKEVQKDLLIEGGLGGHYNGQFAKFLALNVTDLREVVDVKASGKIEVHLDREDLNV